MQPRKLKGSSGITEYEIRFHASSALLRFVYQQRARRDKIMPAKRKRPCPTTI